MDTINWIPIGWVIMWSVAFRRVLLNHLFARGRLQECLEMGETADAILMAEWLKTQTQSNSWVAALMALAGIMALFKISGLYIQLPLIIAGLIFTWQKYRDASTFGKVEDER